MQDSLFYLAFEKVQVDEKNMKVHLWSYRPQINLEHLENTVKTGSKCKILEEFLTIVSLHSVTITVCECNTIRECTFVGYIGAKSACYTVPARHCKATAVSV